MTLEQQVSSIEPSKRLWQLGVKQESTFYWADSEDGVWVLALNTEKELDPIVGYGSELEEGEDGGYFAAFTVAELGEMLPRYVVEGGYSHDLKIIRSSVWRFYYGENIYLTAGDTDTEADARAKMLIYLLENKLITV